MPRAPQDTSDATREEQQPGQQHAVNSGRFWSRLPGEYFDRGGSVERQVGGQLAEHTNHPVELQPTQAYSPASVAKAYLRAVRIEPRLTRQRDFPPGILGHALVAFYGGHLRQVAVPVRLVDFTSMYPTVDILMGNWQLVTADRIDVVDVTQEVNELLAGTELADGFDCARWGIRVVAGADWKDHPARVVQPGPQIRCLQKRPDCIRSVLRVDLGGAATTRC